jgi:hypothetical protein
MTRRVGWSVYCREYYFSRGRTLGRGRDMGWPAGDSKLWIELDAALRARILEACRFVRRPHDFRAEGTVAVCPTSTAGDLRPVSGTRYELQLAAFGPEPVEAVWRSASGRPFLAIGENLKPVGATMLLEDERAILLRDREVLALAADVLGALSEPGSPPIDVVGRR